MRRSPQFIAYPENITLCFRYFLFLSNHSLILYSFLWLAGVTDCGRFIGIYIYIPVLYIYSIVYIWVLCILLGIRVVDHISNLDGHITAAGVIRAGVHVLHGRQAGGAIEALEAAPPLTPDL